MQEHGHKAWPSFFKSFGIKSKLLDITENMRIRKVRLHKATYLKQQVHGTIRPIWNFHVRFKNNVFGKEIKFTNKKAVHALDNCRFALKCSGRSTLVFGKAHDGKPSLANFRGLDKENLLALGKTDGASNSLSRNTFHSCDKHIPAARINHHRDFRKIRLFQHPTHKSQELRSFRIPGIDIHI